MGLRGVLRTLTLPSVNFIPKETEYQDRINVKKFLFILLLKYPSWLVEAEGGGVGFCGWWYGIKKYRAFT